MTLALMFAAGWFMRSALVAAFGMKRPGLTFWFLAVGIGCFTAGLTL